MAETAVDHDTAPAGPLAGVRVLDLTSVLMGPYCTHILRNLGADVIKLESPDGDIVRGLGPGRHPGLTGAFTQINHGKRSISVDLGRPEGRAVCLDIAKTCDVFIHSVRPQAIAKLGLTYDAVRTARPDIVYCNMFGFGRRGRYAGRPAYDDIIQAASGSAMLQAEQLGEPQYPASTFADKIAGLSGAYAILAALYHRKDSGQGQEIDVPLFETMVSCLMMEHTMGTVFDPPLGDAINQRVASPNRRPFKTASGYISVLVYNDNHWRAFCRAADRGDLADDPRFATYADRMRRSDEYNDLIAGILLTKSAEEWQQLLTEADIPCMPLRHPRDLPDDPHLQDVGYYVRQTDQWGEGLNMSRCPVDFYGTPARPPGQAAMLGEHTREILAECGYADDQTAALLRDRVLKITRDDGDGGL